MELISSGIKKEDARFLLPNATCTQIVVTGNARTWYEFFAKRIKKGAQWEIKKLASYIFEKFKEVNPEIFNNEILSNFGE